MTTKLIHAYEAGVKKYGLTAALMPLVAAFALAGCEDAAEVARKPDVIAPIVRDSVHRCDLGKDPVNYADKLIHLLSGMRSSDLDTVLASGITVCIDKRDKPGWRGTSDIYYPRERIIAVRDYGGQNLYEIASLQTIWQLSADAFSPENCGYAIPVKRGTKSWGMFWVANSPQLQSIFEDNPQLRFAPVRTDIK